jgi:hypothetical protein
VLEDQCRYPTCVSPAMRSCNGSEVGVTRSIARSAVLWMRNSGPEALMYLLARPVRDRIRGTDIPISRNIVVHPDYEL